MSFELAYYHGDEIVAGRGGVDGEETEFGPLVEEVPVDVDAVWFREVL